MTSLFLEAAVRSLALGLIAAAALWILRVRSAQVRHMVWSMVLAASLCMPFLPSILRAVTPEEPLRLVTVQVPISVATQTLVSPSAVMPASDVASFDAGRVLVGVYLAVTAFFLSRFSTGLYLTWQIARRASRGGDNVRVSQELRTPVTFGRTILLPANSHLWSEDTLGAVIRHEQAHCNRGDFFTQTLSKLHRTFFWFSPLSWYLDRQLADLAEQCCDDAAVRSMADCSTYAAVLLAFATKSRLSTEAGVAMARLSSVSRRVERLLDAAFVPDSRTLPTISKWKIIAGMLPVAILTAAYSVSLEAQPPVPPVPPSRPANRPQPPKPGRPTTIEFQGETFVMVQDGNSLTMNGRLSDVRRARGLQAKPPYIFMRRDGKEYLIEDKALIAQVQDLFRGQDELGKLQSELGAKQSLLGEQQSKLGEQQSTIDVQVPDLTKEVESLSKLIRDLKGRKVQLDEIGDLQSRLGDLQSRLGELHGQGGQRMAEFGKRQAELGAQQAELGKKQAELGEKQARAAEKAQTELERRLRQWISEGVVKPLP